MNNNPINEPTTNQPVQYAGFAHRLIAVLIDNLLFRLLLTPVFMLFFEQPNYTEAEIQTILKTQGPAGLLNPNKLLIQQVIVLAITAFFWVKYCGTPGKRLVGLKVVDAKTYAPLTPVQAVTRYLGYFISIMPLGMGIFWLFFDDKKQTWHDKFAHSVVIKTQQRLGSDSAVKPAERANRPVINLAKDDDDVFTA